MNNSESEIERLIGLGYLREDLKVLPNGEVVIAPQNEMKKTFEAVERATAPERLKRLTEKKKELDYMASSHAIAGMELPADFEAEYMRVVADIERTTDLAGRAQP